MYQPRMHFQELGGADFDGSPVISPLGFPLRLLQYKYKQNQIHFLEVQIHICALFLPLGSPSAVPISTYSMQWLTVSYTI